MSATHPLAVLACMLLSAIFLSRPGQEDDGQAAAMDLSKLRREVQAILAKYGEEDISPLAVEESFFRIPAIKPVYGACGVD